MLKMFDHVLYEGDPPANDKKIHVRFRLKGETESNKVPVFRG